MDFLTSTELRHTLKISRSTEHRLLKSGMPSIGGGRLRSYDQEVAIEWFRTHAHQATTSSTMLEPGDYQCPGCGFQGSIQTAIAATKGLGPAPRSMSHVLRNSSAYRISFSLQHVSRLGLEVLHLE